MPPFSVHKSYKNWVPSETPLFTHWSCASAWMDFRPRQTIRSEELARIDASCGGLNSYSMVGFCRSSQPCAVSQLNERKPNSLGLRLPSPRSDTDIRGLNFCRR